MSMIATVLALILTLSPQTPPASQQPAAAAPSATTEELWNAARDGDLARVTKALQAGADLQAKTRYGATVLTFAADKGHLDVVKLLLERGADPNAQDTFYKFRALDMALMNEHDPVAILLLERGSKGADRALGTAIQRGSVPVAQAALASPELTGANLRTALGAAKRSGKTELAALIDKKLATVPAEASSSAVAIDRRVLQSYVGNYRNDASGFSLSIELSGDQL